MIVHGLQICELLHQLQSKHSVRSVIHEGMIYAILPRCSMIGQLVFPNREHLDVSSENGDSAGLDRWVSARCCRKSILCIPHVALALSPPYEESTMCCYELPHILWVFL